MKKTLKIIGKILLGLCFICLIGIIGVGVYFYPTMKQYQEEAKNLVEKSDKNTFDKMNNTYIYGSDGKEIAKLSGERDSIYLKYEQIPREAVQAFVAVEDRRFWEHKGIDMRGIARVFFDAVVTKGEEVHGASTITQQLARNVFLSHEVKLERKIKEIFISLELEKKYTKEEIIEFYINNIYFANRYYGIGAAAEGYFGKSVDQLSLSQIATLCAIPNRPTLYNPITGLSYTLQRRDKILDDMEECGFINSIQCSRAKKEKIKIQEKKEKLYNYRTTYAIDCAVRALMKNDGFQFRYKFDSMGDYRKYLEDYEKKYAELKEQLYLGGYKVYTTLDSAKQKILQKAVDETLSFHQEKSKNGIYELQGASTMIDNKNGKVVAIVGGRSQGQTSYTLNRGFQSYRQPGSTIKPLIDYGPAFEIGYTPNSVMNDVQKEDGPKNASGEYSGAIDLRTALKYSKNTVAWELFEEIGAKKALSYIQKMQFQKIVPNDYYNPISLGGMTYGVTTTEMASAYSTLVNDGIYREVTCIKKILNSDGKNIYKRSKNKKIYTKTTARYLIDMMEDVIKSGTARSMNWSLNTSASGKTGTTNDNKDGWFCGVTPYYSIAVWVGFDIPKTVYGLGGGTYPMEIWKQAMEKIVIGLPEKHFIKVGEDIEETVSTQDKHSIQWLEGRSDSEELSAGYTVGNYKADHALGSKADQIMESIYKTTDGKQAKQLLDELKDTIDDIYGTTLREQYRSLYENIEQYVDVLNSNE